MRLLRYLIYKAFLTLQYYTADKKVQRCLLNIYHNQFLAIEKSIPDNNTILKLNDWWSEYRICL